MAFEKSNLDKEVKGRKEGSPKDKVKDKKALAEIAIRKRYTK